MNLFDSIWEDRPAAAKSFTPVQQKQQKQQKQQTDHTRARDVYAAYLRKVEELKRHQMYAERVARATIGVNKTPVRPLATMGTAGGPLLCDYCKKPLVLESHPCYNVPVDVAWDRHPELQNSRWVSYIKGGLVVRLVENGTLRIYHGYDGNPGHCCTLARIAMNAAEAAYTSDAASIMPLIHAFVRDEFPDSDHNRLASDVYSVMFTYDPGYGVNVPDEQNTELGPLKSEPSTPAAEESM